MRTLRSRRRFLAALPPLVAGCTLAVASRRAFAWADEPGQPSTEMVPPDVDARLLAPSFQMVVPFRTQKDGGRWQTSNCGPATLGMLLDAYEMRGHETDDLRIKMHTYQGTVGMRTGIGLEHLARVAVDLGVTTYGLYRSGGTFRGWQVDDVVAELRQGHPVMPLVRLYLVPGYERHAARWGHYILLTGVTPDGFIFSDSLKTDEIPGTNGLISGSELAAAMASSHIPGQAVAFSGPRELPILAS